MSVFRPGLFKDKVAIVTGGGTGIGKAISEELLTLGASVVIASRDGDKVRTAADDMKRLGDVQSTRCNIRKEEDVKSLVEFTLEKYGKLDFLVNNGGGQFPCGAADMSLKGWNAVIETNLTGTYLMCREAHRQYMGDNGGSIVNIIADMFRGFPMMSHTGAARAGVDNLTKSLSVEWASDGVRVNSVAPGSSIYSPTASANYGEDLSPFELARPGVPAKRLGSTYETQMIPFSGAARAGVENLGKSLSVEWAGDGVRVNSVAPGVVVSPTARDNYDYDVFDSAIPHIPVKRLGGTREVSSAVCFLLSPGASFISGATLRVDAGGSLHSPQLWQIPEHDKIPEYSWDPYTDKSKL